MAGSTNPFKLGEKGGSQKVDIETLFMDLKGKSEISYLYTHQADILREYQTNYTKSSDLGIELPTGSGKTLVGLLIAEWRRRTLEQRVLYLCPTRQLAYQVSSQSRQYGIDNSVFIGSKKRYDQTNLTLYRSAKIIAISTYSGLFNVNPGIYDPQTIILDDAHGAESYIGSMWSLDIDRQTNSELYYNIIELFKKDLPPHFVNAIIQSNRDRLPFKTEKVPFSALYRNITNLREILDSTSSPDEDSDLYFSWMTVRKGLPACNVYISYDNILIRPYIPPTLTHPPFAKAEQRIYMSATLGHGGELERITGIRSIHRIRTPGAYQWRGTGRRLFLFPDFSKDPIDYNQWITKRLSLVDRTLVLCPNQYRTRQFRNNVEKYTSNLSFLGAQNIEESIEPFIISKNSVLLLHNRYDGIDLPGGICKQMIIDGLPTGTNLQEVFLQERLGLEVLLKERVKTRIEQASGRCTRRNTDRAAIIMFGRPLLDFCTRIENQNIFHPELRAEIKFALDQPYTTSKLDAMLKSFMDNDENWKAAEEYITSQRADEKLPDMSVTNILANTVKNEVDFSYAMWMGDYERALSNSKDVVDGLSGGKVAPYRAFWCYLASNAAYLHSQSDKKFEKVPIDYLERAKEACRTVSWFPYALKALLQEQKETEDPNELQAIAIEGIVEFLCDLGPVSPRFNEKLEEIEQALRSVKANAFDQGLVELGKMLGFTSWKPPITEGPDAVWQLGNHVLLLLEGKSDESPDSGVSVQNCRQTSGHLDWAKSDPSLKDTKQIYSVLVSPKSKIDDKSLPHSNDIYFVNISDIIKLFEKIRSMLKIARESMTNEVDNIFRERILDILTRMNLRPDDVIPIFISKKVTELPIV